MIKNYLKIAWRNLKSNKAYASINIVGLALGISTCLIIFLIAQHELTYDTFHPGKEKIYRIVGSLKFKSEPPRPVGYVPPPLPMRVREELTGFEQVTGFYNYYAKVSVPQTGKEAKLFEVIRDKPSPIIVAEAPYFSIFQYQWVAGSAATAMNEPFKVVLTESAAKKYFEDAPASQLIGRELVYNDSLHVHVAGIVKDFTHNTDFGFTDFISFPTVRQSFLKENIDLGAWGMWDYYSQAYVKLAEGITPQQVEAQFPGFVKKNIWGASEEDALKLQPLSNVHFNEDYQDGYARKVHLPTLYGLMGIAVFILLIAVVNFINLSTAQSIKRSKEIGIRKVLGSNRLSLRLQFFSETFILTLAAVVLSVILLKPILTAFSSFIPSGVLLDPFHKFTALFLLGVALFTTLLAGFYPARILSAFKPVESLKGQSAPKGHHRNYLRKSLIVFQFTISLVFIIGTVVVGKQIHYMLNTDLGFDKDAIIILRPKDATPESKILLTQKLRQLSGVTAASIHAETPAAQRHGGTVIKNIGSAMPENEISSSFSFVDANYLPLYDLKLLAGRNLLPSDTLREFVINEACAKSLGFTTPASAVGQMVQVGISGKKGPIVGVMQDFHSKSFHEAIKPFFLTTNAKSTRTISVKLATNGQQMDQVKNTLATVEKTWRSLYPDKEPTWAFFDETIATLYEKEEKTAQLMNTAMFMAILISCMGLFGLATFTMQQRTKEIGIRKVLGASISNITAMLSMDFLKLVFIAAVIASPIAWYFMNLWLEDFAYRTTISWWVFLLAGAAAILIALFTIGFQAIKAAITNPVKSLRSE
jgi:putative ABC transport system permease protein